MTAFLNHSEVQELLGAYAVHAIDDDDSRAIEAHIQGCAECAEELAQLLDASAMYGMTELEEPSGEIWGRIQSEIRRNVPTFADESESAVASAPVISLDTARQRRAERAPRWRIAVASAAAAAAIAIPATLSFAGGSTAPTLAAIAKQTQGQVGSRTLPLLDAAGVSLADAVISSTGQGFIRPSTLTALPDTQTYQLWLIKDGVAISSGLLGSQPGVSTFTVRNDVDAIAISVEPASGSLAPSSTPVAVASLA